MSAVVWVKAVCAQNAVTKQFINGGEKWVSLQKSSISLIIAFEVLLRVKGHSFKLDAQGVEEVIN